MKFSLPSFLLGVGITTAAFLAQDKRFRRLIAGRAKQPGSGAKNDPAAPLVNGKRAVSAISDIA